MPCSMQEIWTGGAPSKNTGIFWTEPDLFILLTDRSVNDKCMAPRKKEENEKIQEKSREKILMAALELFARQGYALTSVESISKKAKVSKGLIYHYFRNKEAILQGLFARLLEEGEQLFKGSENLSPEQFLKRTIAFSVQFIVNNAKVNRLVIALSVQPEVIRGLKKEMAKARDEWFGKLVEAFKALGYEQPEAEAYLFAATFDGIGIGYVTMEHDYPIGELQKLLEKRYGL